MVIARAFFGFSEVCEYNIWDAGKAWSIESFYDVEIIPTPVGVELWDLY